MLNATWDYIYQWVMHHSHEAGFRDPLMWFLTILIALHGGWLYFGTSWNEIWVQRIGHRNKFLRVEAPWPRTWWHHPQDEWSPLLGHIFIVAMFFELWWLTTRLHGRKLLRQERERPDSTAVPD